jgi:hypothetical protein
MKIQSLIVALLVSGLFNVTHAEHEWKKGYVVLNTGDTVKGEVRLNSKKEVDLYTKVQLKISETEKKSYSPEKIKAYGYEDIRFLSRKVGGEPAFLKVLTAGRINIYEYQYELQRGSSIVSETEYFIEKTDKPDAEPQKLKMSKFKKIVADLMADHTDLVERVQSEDEEFELTNCLQVVQEYNEWSVNQQE